MSNVYSAWNVLTLALFSAVAATACGDDESALNNDTDTDDGGAPHASATTSEDAASSNTEPETHDAGEDDCASIKSACSGKDDTDGLGNLCLRVAEGDDAEECATLNVDCQSYCATGEPSSLDAGELDEELCKAMGDTCHDFDEGSGLGHLCHEVGHTGNIAWCAAIFDDCVALCGEPEEHHDDEHEHDAGDAGDASYTGPTQSLTLQFGAKVGALDFACGTEYADFGSTQTTVTPQDLRFYVSRIRLITATGEQVAVEIDEQSPFQGGGVALLDFENAEGACRNGSAVTNTAITVTAPEGDYTGVAFSTSVPFDLNHGDPLTLPDPLQAGDMTWGWLFGYKFIKVEFVQVLAESPTLDASLPDAASVDRDSGVVFDAGDAGNVVSTGDAEAPVPGVGIFHMGSTGCTNLLGQDASADEFSVECSMPNVNDIVLEDFDPEVNIITLDLGLMFAGTDLSTMSMCHGMGESCNSLFDSVGLAYQTGEAQTLHAAFGVE